MSHVDFSAKICYDGWSFMTYKTPRPRTFDVYVKRSATGLGLFANEAIPRRRFIIEYWGKVIPDEKAQDIGGKYLFEVGNGKTIVGTTRKNIARYINHSCRPNCEVEIKAGRVYIYSRRNIKAGEELTYDYGKEYWDYFIKPHGCRCAKCKGKKA